VKLDRIKANWASWLQGAVWLVGFASIFAQGFLFRRAILAGKSPLNAFSESRYTVTHVLLNPWISIPFLIALLALLVFSIYAGTNTKCKNANWWFIAALLISLISLVLRLARPH
jgi:hypothetical protein